MKNTPQKYDSLGFFNLVRGLGLLLVIVGHSIALFLPKQTPAVVFPVFSGAGRVLGGSVMAMFFMISGFYFYRRSPKKCLNIQARLLLKPYFLTALAIAVCKLLTAIFKGYSFLKPGLGLTLSYLLGLNVSSGATLFGLPVNTISIFWFVLAVFGGWVLYNLILCLPNRKLQRITIAACIIVSWIMTEISRVWPFALPMALLAVGYIAFGHEVRMHHLIDAKLPKSVWIAIGLVSLVSMAFGYVDIATCIWKLGLIDVVGSFCLGFLLLRLYGKFMYGNCKGTYLRRSRNGNFIKLMEFIGLHSIRVVCLHAFEKAVIPWQNLGKLLPNAPALCSVICFVGRCIVIWLLFKLIRYLSHNKPTPITIET